MSTDEAAVALTTEEQVLNALGGQIEGMRAAGYDRSKTLDSEVVAINATSALHTAEFSRRRADGARSGPGFAGYAAECRIARGAAAPYDWSSKPLRRCDEDTGAAAGEV